MAQYWWRGDDTFNNPSLENPANYFLDSDLTTPSSVVPGSGDEVMVHPEAEPADGGTTDALWVVDSDSGWGAWYVSPDCVFNGDVNVESGQEFGGGIHYGKVISYGTLMDGTYHGEVVNNGALWSDVPVYYGPVENHGDWDAGTVHGTFMNYGDINGGDFRPGSLLINDHNIGYFGIGNLTLAGDVVFTSNANQYFPTEEIQIEPTASFKLYGNPILYGPQHESVADPSDVRAGVTNLEDVGTLEVGGGGSGRIIAPGVRKPGVI